MAYIGESRHSARLVLMYKIVNGLVKIDATERFVQLSRLSGNMSQHSFQIPSCNNIIRKESFYPRTIRDWNALPTDTATVKSLESFKTPFLDYINQVVFTCTFILHNTLLLSFKKISLKLACAPKWQYHQ